MGDDVGALEDGGGRPLFERAATAAETRALKAARTLFADRLMSKKEGRSLLAESQQGWQKMPVTIDVYFQQRDASRVRVAL